MRTPILKAVTLLALTTLSALAVAADAPARVGRVALAQGQVDIRADDEANAAQVNWPVTSGNTISTAAGARTEVRIGSTSIRLDGDSALEVLQLDDDTMRLRLHYGSASIRIVNREVLEGFALETPQARVRLQQPGRIRIDAERVRDTSFVTVFDGAALVDSGASQLTVRAGKRAEVGADDVRTLAASRDAFDDWAIARDRVQDTSTSARYVTTEMTGYEDLDRYGSWSTNDEYGSLWYPSVASSWVPYRDGSWTWLDPWGWTWVDNAPWGYAPFHYGRWVQVRNRWAWAPGRRADRVVWAPALVGWVGGGGWNVAFRDRSRHPGTGWYPLTPHDRFVPTWGASANHIGWLNQHVRPDPRRPRDYRPPGLTVVPQDRFGRPGRVDVPRVPIATLPPTLGQNAPAGTPPPGPQRPGRPNRPDGGARPDNGGRPDNAGRPDNGGRPDRPAGTNRPEFAGRPERPETGTRPEPANRPDTAGRPDQGNRPDRNGLPDRGDWDRDQERGGGRIEAGRIDSGRLDTGRLDTGRVERDGFVRPRPGQVAQAGNPAPGLVAPAAPVQPQPVVSPTPHLPQQPLSTVTSPPPRQSPQPLVGTSPTPQQGVPEQFQRPGNWRGDGDRNDRNERRERMEEMRRNRPQAPAPIQTAPPVAPVQAAPAPPAPRFERPEAHPETRPEMRQERPQREASAAPRPAPAPAPQARAGGEERRQHTDGRGRNQDER